VHADTNSGENMYARSDYVLHRCARIYFFFLEASTTDGGILPVLLTLQFSFFSLFSSDTRGIASSGPSWVVVFITA
jgi:hypothetical protein